MKLKDFFSYKFEIFFVTLLLHLLYPFLSLLLVIPIDAVRFISFTLVVVASFNLAIKKIPRLLIITLGIISDIGVWSEYLFDDPLLIHYLRIYATCFFYMVLIYVLTKKFLDSNSITLKVVIGAMSGYMLIGYLGASTIEMMEFHHPGSYSLGSENLYDFTYLSYVSMLTVGYGDIVPITASAKSLTILISLLGQLYMAVGITSFVGKFMNKKKI